MYTVEISLDVVRAARALFHLPHWKVRVVVDDAEEFMLKSREAYELVLDDVWRDDVGFVKSLFHNPRYAAAVDRCVAQNGAYAINLWRHPPVKSEVPHATRALQPFFKRMLTLRPPCGPTAVLAAMRKSDESGVPPELLDDYSIRAQKVRLNPS